jgi:hypothetical protein
MASLTPFTQVTQMRLIVVLLSKIRRLHFHIMPLLQPIYHSVNIRLLINLRPTERLALLAALVEDSRIIPILPIESYVGGDGSAAPVRAAASTILAPEVA